MSAATTRLAVSLLPISVGIASEGLAQSIHWESAGATRLDRLGRSVDFLADLDGDGKPEALVGAPSDNFASEPGRALVFGSSTGAIVHEWHGDEVGDEFGIAVASAGDVDGDGIADVIVGAPDNGGPSDFTGAVRVFSGATGNLLLEIPGPATFAYFGACVTGPGDLDGDGLGDVVVASVWTGTVSAWSGVTGSPLWQVVGSRPDDFGARLDAISDLDGDGVRDVIVGAPISKEVHLLSGSSGATIRVLTDSGSQEGFGARVAEGGDFDSDGVSDVLVSNPWYSTFGNNSRGAVWLFSGADGARLDRLIGTFDDEELGNAIAGTPDLDGDGTPDFAASRFSAVADVKFFSGRTRGLIRSIDSEIFVSELAVGSDLDGDAVPDLLIGNSSFHDVSGSGPHAGAVETCSGKDGNTIWIAYGRAFAERRGASVAVLGDVDGDGWRDVLVGSPSNDDRMDPPGVVRLLSGRDASELRSHQGQALGDLYGSAITAIPDFTGDGLPEYAISALNVALNATAVEVRSGSDGALLYALPRLTSDLDSVYGTAISAGKGPNGRVVLAVGDTGGSGSGEVGYVDLFDLATGSLLLTATGDFGRGFGSAVSFVGDVDGDGEGDWIAGQPFTDFFPNSDCGSAFLFSGANGATLRRFDGTSTSQRLGSAVTGIGDLDGDGLPDVLVTAPEWDRGFVTAFSSSTGQTLFNVLESTSVDFEYLASLGDINRDGVDDFVIGGYERIGNDGFGRAYVHSGHSQGLLARFGPSDGEDAFGQRFATAATGVPIQIDPDRIPDLLVGTPTTESPGYENGLVTFIRLDDLMLQLSPASAAAGATVSIDTRGGPAGSLVGLFAVSFDATPLGFFVAFSTFDPLGTWSLSGVVPTGLSGHSLTLLSYAIGFNGKLADSQPAVLTFL